MEIQGKSLRMLYRLLPLCYGIFWGVLRWLYILSIKTYTMAGLKGKLPAMWWLLTLLYFVADVWLVLGFVIIRRKLGGTNRLEKSIWYVASELVPIWFLLHLFLLVIDSSVSARLEQIGLGILEPIIFVIFLITGLMYALRTWEVTHGR